jgi:NAD(P)-dependent dehydrogenase (short-subunit alcohol dehydrogenase family)
MSEAYFWNRTAIVTGAASGLGRALAGELARRGAWVYLVDRNEAQCHEAVHAIVRPGLPPQNGTVSPQRQAYRVRWPHEYLTPAEVNYPMQTARHRGR